MTRRVRLSGALAVGVLLGTVLWLPPRKPPPPSLDIQVDIRTEAAAPSFTAMLQEVLADPRGWSATGTRIVVVEDSLYRLGITTSDDMGTACAPYGAASKYACRPGPIGFINAGLWDTPPSWWPGDRDSYRRHALNHELGHLLGLLGHPPCPGAGQPLPVMALPPREETPCIGDGWPTAAEIDALRAARGTGVAAPAAVDVSRPDPDQD